MYVGKGDSEKLRRRDACSVAHAFKRALQSASIEQQPASSATDIEDGLAASHDFSEPATANHPLHHFDHRHDSKGQRDRQHPVSS
jgi:hypothetical protein